MSRDPLLYLNEMLDAVHRAISYGESLEGDSLATDRLRTDAIIRCLEILGEATKQISPEYRMAGPSIAWKDLAGMRDVLTHGYFRVDLEVVSDVVFQELPVLREQLLSLWHHFAGVPWEPT